MEFQRAKPLERSPQLVLCGNSLFAELEGRRLAMDSEGSFVS